MAGLGATTWTCSSSTGRHPSSTIVCCATACGCCHETLRRPPPARARPCRATATSCRSSRRWRPPGAGRRGIAKREPRPGRYAGRAPSPGGTPLGSPDPAPAFRSFPASVECRSGAAVERRTRAPALSAECPRHRHSPGLDARARHLRLCLGDRSSRGSEGAAREFGARFRVRWPDSGTSWSTAIWMSISKSLRMRSTGISMISKNSRGTWSVGRDVTESMMQNPRGSISKVSASSCVHKSTEPKSDRLTRMPVSDPATPHPGTS